MLKRILSIALAVSAIFVLATCQAVQTSARTETPVPLERWTQTSTEIAAPSSTAPCFTPIDLIPLSFTPDSEKLAIRTGGSDIQPGENERRNIC